jgi:ribonuclease D
MSQWRVATSADVAEAAAIAADRGRLGIDTEFMSEGRYRALLCLAQIVVDPPDPAGLPHILLIDALNRVDVRPLARVLSAPEVEIVLHAGRQDVAILRRQWSTDINNVFDTQIAAGFAGASAQAGYSNLLSQMIGRRVGKTASYTRWDARPLTGEQLSYAAEDVAHLLELSDDLQRRLTATGRLEWAQEECRRLESATDERDPETAWERLPRVRQLDPRARAVAKELAGWRERTAAGENRPVGSILSDAPLVELAKRQPSSIQGIEQIRGVHPSITRRRGQAILDAVARGLEAPQIPREEGRSRSDPADAPRIALAEALLRARALEAGLAYELIASRSELEQIVAAARQGEAPPQVRTLEGWRSELVGDDLSDLLAGKSSLMLGPNGRLLLTKAPPPN